MKKKVNLPKKGAGRRLAARLKADRQAARDSVPQSILDYLGTSQPYSPPPPPEFVKEQFRNMVCSCWNPAHTATIFFDDDEWYLTFHLTSSRSVWWRLWAAIKYVLGFTPSKFGHWDEVIIRHHDLLQLKKMLSVVY